MTYEKAGLNLSKLSNIEPLELNISTSWSEIQQGMILTTINEAGIWYPIIIYTAMLVMLYWAFTEISPFSTFRYTYLRALPLALGIVNLVSITMLSIGYTGSFRVVAIFFILNILTSVMVMAIENNQ